MPAGRSARYVEATPPRGPPSLPRYRTTDTVSCTSRGLTSGLLEMEYCRGVNRTSTSCHCSGATRTANSRTMSRPLRSTSQRSSSPLRDSRTLLAALSGLCSATNRNRFGVTLHTSYGDVSAACKVISPPSTASTSAPPSPVASSQLSTTNALLSGTPPTSHRRNSRRRVETPPARCQSRTGALLLPPTVTSVRVAAQRRRYRWRG